MWPLVLLWGCLVLPGYRALQGPKEVTGLEGNSVSVQCTYGDELRAHSKYWCREAGMFLSRCSGTIHAAKDGSETTEGRVSIRDSPEERLFTVTLRALTPTDTGEYWCGARTLRSHKFFRVFVRVIPVATTKQGNGAAKTSSIAGTSLYGQAASTPYPGTSLPTRTSPYRRAASTGYPGTSLPAGTFPYGRVASTRNPETSLATGTPSHPGSSIQAVQQHKTPAEDAAAAPSNSEARVTIPTARMLSPFLVLLSLLLAAGLIALGSHMLGCGKEAPPVSETEKSQGTEVYFSTLAPEEVTTPSQFAEEDRITGDPPCTPEEQQAFSKFVSV
ncbi:CMRF35-like molecule 9 isoform X2 [Ochotona princeps]|uniref:CMRF35-like molecule 9 isoform X2 n=1 Tax=Ochotona princeps TaxID=9978 RepID=UPI0027148A94|nr:CMRF35-like molecule 9 isoform X2 [Ochotona princeps]